MNARIIVFVDTKEGHQPVGTAGVVTCVDSLYTESRERTREILIKEATKAVDRALDFYDKYRSGEIEAPPLDEVMKEEV